MADGGDSSRIRWRGREVSRLECFSDAVFAFALTLLVVSLEVPKTYDAMIVALKNFPAFAFCFIALFGVWSRHNEFFRRTGLEDFTTRGLTGCLLFVVLAYVYPLKFLSALFINGLLYGSNAAGMPAIGGASQIRGLFVLYGVGGALVPTLLGLMYFHAHRVRDELGGSDASDFDLRASGWRFIARSGVPVASIVLACVLPGHLVGLAGYAYFLIGPVEAVIGSVAGRAARRREEGSPAQA